MFDSRPIRAMRGLVPVAAAFGFGAVVAVVAFVGGGSAVAQDAGTPAGIGDMDMAEMMANYAEMQKPGEHHADMAYFEGIWDCTVTFSMGPGQPEMTSRGVATYAWKFDGRWMEQSYQGEMMGQPFQGFGLMGYDNYRKQYLGTWIDDLSTSMLVSAGSTMPGSNQIVMFGKMDEPMTGEIGKTIKTVTTRHGDDRFVFEMQEVQYGDPFTVMSIEYRRRNG